MRYHNATIPFSYLNLDIAPQHAESLKVEGDRHHLVAPWHITFMIKLKHRGTLCLCGSVV